MCCIFMFLPCLYDFQLWIHIWKQWHGVNLALLARNLYLYVPSMPLQFSIMNSHMKVIAWSEFGFTWTYLYLLVPAKPLQFWVMHSHMKAMTFLFGNPMFEKQNIAFALPNSRVEKRIFYFFPCYTCSLFIFFYSSKFLICKSFMSEGQDQLHGVLPER